MKKKTGNLELSTLICSSFCRKDMAILFFVGKWCRMVIKVKLVEENSLKILFLVFWIHKGYNRSKICLDN